MVKLKRIDLIRIYFRSFLIQASWNYRGMLNLGFLFTILPGLYRLHRTREDRLKAAVRHLDFFNTHPYLASYAVGATLSAEEEAINKGDETFDEVMRLKRSLCIGILGAYLWGIWGPVIFFALYNIPHFLVRYWGLRNSYKDRISFVNELSGRVYKTVPALGERLGAFFMGCLVVIFVGYEGQFNLEIRLVFAAGLLITYLLLRKFKKYRVLHGTVLIILVAAWLAGV
jgi:PTS system mannose-specific IID component